MGEKEMYIKRETFDTHHKQTGKKSKERKEEEKERKKLEIN